MERPLRPPDGRAVAPRRKRVKKKELRQQMEENILPVNNENIIVISLLTFLPTVAASRCSAVISLDRGFGRAVNK